jgi:hypothetical protein
VIAMRDTVDRRSATFAGGSAAVKPLDVTTTSYAVRMVDGGEFAWDGVTTVLVGGATFLVAPQGTRLAVAQVLTMAPVDAP